jgi:hypothetical protein
MTIMTIVPFAKNTRKGLCGALFQKWLQCTDQHPGKDPVTNQDHHLTACASHAQALSDCLNQHDSYYDTPQQPQNPFLEEQELRQAWQRLIKEELHKIPPRPFPSDKKPILEFRVTDRLAVAMVDLEENQQPLVLVHIQDATTNELLSAGSKADLLLYQEKGVLQCHLPTKTTQIIVSALYETGENPVLYTHLAHVPPLS